jgi:hypothetical protein
MAELSPRTVNLDSSRLEPFEIGARLLSTLAFPGAKEEDACNKAAEALCADQLRVTIVADSINAGEWKSAYPKYAAIDKAECRCRLRTFNRRLRDRMIAARMSLAFFAEGIAQQPAKLPPLMKRHSLNELSKLALRQFDQNEIENVVKRENLEHRAWRKSLPVIHIAAAMQIAIRVMAPEREMVGYPLDNAGLHEAIIQLAQLHEEIVLLDQRFGKNRNQLIRIRSGAEKP